MVEDGPRLLTQRGPDRRQNPLPPDWADARPVLELWIEGLHGSVSDLSTAMGNLAANVGNLTTQLGSIRDDAHKATASLRHMEDSQERDRVDRAEDKAEWRRLGERQADLAKDLARTMVKVGALVAILTTLAAAVITYSVRALAPMVTAPTVDMDYRLTVIAEELEVWGDRPRNADGTPALRALNAALPELRRVTPEERAAACLRAPGACQRP